MRLNELTEANRQRDEAAFELESARGALREQEDRVLRLEGEEKQHQVLFDAICQAADGNQKEIDAIDSRMQANQKHQAKLKSDCDALQSRLDDLQKQMDALSGNRSEADEQGRSISDEITAGKIQLAQLAAEKHSVGETILQLKSLTADLEGMDE